jgi:hypothetical protein
MSQQTLETLLKSAGNTVDMKVAPVPYARDAREGYHEGWRTRQS